MAPIELEFKLRLDRLIRELMHIESKVELLFHINKRKADRLDQLNIAPAFFGLVIDSLQSDTIISLSRIYDRDPNSSTLFDLLQFVEANLEIFTPESLQSRDPNGLKFWQAERQITQEVIDKQRREIESFIDILHNLRLRRNKRYAHFDKQYAYEPLKLNEDAPLTFADFRKLISVAKSIADSYLFAFDNSSRSWQPTNLFDIDKVLEILYKYQKQFD